MSFYGPGDLMQGAPQPGANRRIAYENEILFLDIVFEPGFVMAPHKHTWPTLYHITDGSGRALIGEEWKDLVPGTLVMIPPDTMHGFEAVTRVKMVEVQSNCPSDFVDRLLGR